LTLRPSADLSGPAGPDSPRALRSPAVVPAARSDEEIRAERRAWVVIWLAFATFCLLAGSTAKVVVDYVATADMHISATVEVPRGNVFVQSPGGPARYQLASSQLDVGSIVMPDRAASVRLRLLDNSAVSVLAGAKIELARMDVGRFINRRTIEIRQFAGPVHYETVDEVQVVTPGGTVHAKGSGVTVWVQGERTKVLVYSGEVRVDVGGGVSQVVTSDQRADFGTDHKISGGARAEQLLQNGDFAQQDQDWQTHDVQTGPRDVDGLRYWTDGPVVAGVQMPALRIVRTSIADAHGETGLTQKMNLDVSGYRNLWLRAWVRVDSQKLSGGGQGGSEYPLMFVLKYEGSAENSQPGWNHGFYIGNWENRPVPWGQQIEAGTWIEYQVDLMTQSDAYRPYRIAELSVMGQGHSYDSRVADVRLVAE